MRFLHFLVFTVFFIFGTANVLANHVLGGNITWTCLGGNNYQVTLTSYVDCYGYDLATGIPASETVYMLPSGCASTAFSADLNFVSNTQISELCPSELAFSSCSGGVNMGVMQFVYQGLVTLTPGCNWNVVWNGGNWSYFVNNTSFTQPLYIHSSINTNFPCAPSPVLASSALAPQVPYVCAGSTENHQVSLLNLPAGYTVTYSLGSNLVLGADIFSPPISSPGFSLPPGMNLTSPSGTGVTINWPGVNTAVSLGTNVVRLQIIIFDGSGNQVGVINETMMFFVRNCAVTNTQFTAPPVTSTGPETTVTGGNNISVCAGDSLIFTVSATNSNALRSITITDDLPLAGLPTLTATQEGNNQANMTYSMLTTGAHVGTYTLNVHAEDDACPTPDTDDTVINITIHPNVQLTFSDTTICFGESLTLEAQGLTNATDYDWEIISGDPLPLPTDGEATQIVSPDSNTVYRVSGVGVPAVCQTFDEVNVNVLMQDLTHIKSDETCGNNNGSIDLTVVGSPSSNLTYTWSPVSGGIIDGQQNQASLNSGTYTVTVDETVYGCQLTETVIIGDVPAPTATFTGDTTICAGDAATLTLTLTQGSAPFSYTGTNIPAGASPSGPTNIDTFTVSPASTTIYTITGLTDASNCTAAVNLSVTVTVRPIVTASFAPEGPICAGDPLSLDVTFSQSGNYDLSFTHTTPAPPLVATPYSNLNIPSGPVTGYPNPTVAGVHNYDIDAVAYTNAPFCASIDASNPSINVTVNPKPTATLTGGGGYICNGDCRNLTLTLTGAGPWTVGYKVNNGVTQYMAVAASPFVWNVCPIVNSTYCIVEVEDANCESLGIVGICATLTVASFPTLGNYTLSATDVCEGDQAQLTVNFTPSAPAEACLYFSTSPTSTFATDYCSQVSPFTVNVNPTATTAYCLDSMHIDGFDQCVTVITQCLTLNVNGDIAVVPTDTICNSINTQYQIVYSLSGGEAPYVELAGGGSGAFNPTNPAEFTTTLVSNGPSGPWSFNDVHACNTVTLNTIYTCPVTSDAGTMPVIPINICGNGQAAPLYNNDGFLDGNDELMFILYTNASNPLGSVVQQNCNAPEFSFTVVPPMAYGTTYYISAVVGDLGAPGCVNLLAPNVQVSVGTPVTWYQTPTATLTAPGSTEACEGSCVTLNIARTGQAPWNIVYHVGGAPGADSPITINAGDPVPYSFCSDEDGLHELISISSGVGVGQCVGTVSGTVDVTINPLPTASFDGNASTCFGVNHCFEIALTGEAPWNVVIDDPITPDDVENGIAASPYNGYCVGDAGNYQIISVTDANCTNSTPSASVALTVNQLPSVQWVTSDTTFCQNATVDLDYAIQGGLAPFDIDFNVPDAGVTDPTLGSASTGFITAGVVGAYEIVSVTDANGCESAAGDIVNVGQINTPIADAGPDADQCVGVAGTIGALPSPDHSYSWAVSSGGPVPVPSNISSPTVTVSSVIAPITYTVTATVAQCSSTDAMVLTVHALPVFSVTADADSLCFGTCTELQASVTGAGTLTYEWTPSTSITTPLASDLVTVCPLANETYEVTAFETHGNVICEATETIDIVIGTEIIVAEDFTEQICNGTCEGEIHLVPSGGFPDYEFDVTSEITSLDNLSLCPDIYDYAIIDRIGCIVNGSIEIEEREPEVIDDITITQPDCAYDFGTIEVNNVYNSYTISSECGYVANPASLTSGLFENVPPCADEYTITATFEVSPTDQCSTTITVTITPQSSAITFNAVQWPDNVFCYDEQACFEGTPTGGAVPLDIFWYACPDLNCTEESTAEPFCVPMQSDLTLYGVAIDANGCRSDTVMLEALLSPEITLTVQGGADSTAICEYDCIDLVAAVGGGNGSININWYQLPSNTQIGVDSPFNVCPLDTITYYATASDGCSLDISDTLVVIVHDTPELFIDADIYDGCYPQTINFEVTSVVLDDHTCVWNFGSGPAVNACGPATYTYPDFGTFTPSHTITTEYGCTATDILDVPIAIHGKPQMGFTWEPQPVTVINNRVQFINTTVAAVSYNWEVYGIGNSVMQNPEFVFPPRDRESFEVCLEATTVHGCKDTLCQDIFMETVLQVFVPNAFTPDTEDDNPINDVFLPIITGHDPARYELWIMNHWGDVVFQTTDYTQPWTGNFNGGDTFVPDDTYVWHIECYEMDSNNMKTFNGTVTIVR